MIGSSTCGTWQANVNSLAALRQLRFLSICLPYLMAFTVLTGLAPAMAATHDGTLTGQYSCGENLSATPRAKAPFSLPVELAVKAGRVSGSRESVQTQDTFSGDIDTSGIVVLELVGSWKDDPSRRWFGSFKGRLIDGQVHASGEMLSPDGQRKVRDCTLALNFKSVQVQTAMAPETPLPLGRRDPVGQKPSSDCASADSVNERIICSDSTLTALDREISALFVAAKASSPNPSQLEKDAAARLTAREKKCGDRACLVRWYEEQKAELSPPSLPSSATAASHQSFQPQSAETEPEHTATDAPLPSSQPLDVVQLDPAAAQVAPLPSVSPKNADDPSASALTNAAKSSVGSDWTFLLAVATGSALLIAVGASRQRAGKLVVFTSIDEAALAIFLTLGIPVLGIALWFLGGMADLFKQADASVAIPFIMACIAILVLGKLFLGSLRSNRTIGAGLLSFSVKVAFGFVGILAMLVSLALHQHPTRREDESERQFEDRVSANRTKALAMDVIMISVLAIMGLSLIGSVEDESSLDSVDAADLDKYRELVRGANRQIQVLNDAVDTREKIQGLIDSPKELLEVMLTQAEAVSSVVRQARNGLTSNSPPSTEATALLVTTDKVAEVSNRVANLLIKIKAMQAH